jgi:hypothetical protein
VLPIIARKKASIPSIFEKQVFTHQQQDQGQCQIRHGCHPVILKIAGGWSIGESERKGIELPSIFTG